jgi:glycosyltransferase involved in cell wall biosynthesis
MKVSGFTFIRNAIIYDYPIVESILSILPLCDEVIVAVGKSEDETLQLIQNLESDKIKIIETEWNNSLREGGNVLAIETDKAFHAIAKDSDWAFYIQGDEVLHEKYVDPIGKALRAYKDNLRVEGLLFDYRHFYGSYDYVGESSRWYRKEIRIIRNRRDFFSYKDAQGFRKRPNDKLNVKLIEATIYHYGWVKDPRKMQKKQEDFNRLWNDDQWIEKNVAKREEFDYGNVDALTHFSEDHPQVMKKRISEKNWKFDYDITRNHYTLKEKLKRLVMKLTGLRMGEYQNYKIL